MNEEEFESIWFKHNTDDIYTHLNCKYCGAHSFVGVPNVTVTCSICNKKSRTELKQSMHDRQAPFIIRAINRRDKVIIWAEEYYHRDLTLTRDNWKMMGFVNVSNIEFKEINESHHCRNCGKCLKCGAELNGENITVCPECGTNKIKFTRTKNKEKCHKCGGTNIKPGKLKKWYTLTIERKLTQTLHNIR